MEVMAFMPQKQFYPFPLFDPLSYPSLCPRKDGEEARYNRRSLHSDLL